MKTLDSLAEYVHKLSLGHIIEGFFIYAPFALFGHSIVGWFAVLFYFLGRERRDMEIMENLNPVTDWWRGWAIWRWSRDGLIDLYSPVAFWGIVTLLMNIL